MYADVSLILSKYMKKIYECLLVWMNQKGKSWCLGDFLDFIVKFEHGWHSIHFRLSINVNLNLECCTFNICTISSTLYVHILFCLHYINDYSKINSTWDTCNTVTRTLQQCNTLCVLTLVTWRRDTARCSVDRERDTIIQSPSSP